MKFGLRNMKHLLEHSGNPETCFPSLHIAGTNGKGSTSAFLASIVMEAGYRTALYTSPHLVRFTERIRINGREIPERRLVSYARALRPAIEEVSATFFEATTCIAFRYFADEGVDIAVIEAGLGGRLDSTNVLEPIASIITNVGLDHTAILGTTIRAIAKEKGGIIKSGVPSLTGAINLTALDVLQRIASERRSAFYHAETVVKCSIALRNSRVSFWSPAFSVKNVTLGLIGRHQHANAQLAIATLQIIKNHGSHSAQVIRIGNAAIRRGLINVVRNAGLHGRLETFGRNPRYILDVAHNPPGIRSLVDALQGLGHEKLTVVFGVMRDKDYRAIVRELRRVARTIVVVSPRVERSLGARALYKHIRGMGIPVKLGGNVRNGLRMAAKQPYKPEPILVTGSHYVVGEALEFLRRKKA